jgi:crossover junction endodeoxyribonuclease RusA
LAGVLVVDFLRSFIAECAPVLDNDNMIKPIQDALQDIVYIDDRQIVDTHGHRRDLNERYEVRGMTPEQARGFVADQPFVHIRIEPPPPSWRLP